MDEPTWILEELSGQKRRLALSGYLLPLADGVAWRGAQRRSKTHYPGSSEATIQVLGPDEGEGQFAFRLDRRRMGGADDVGRQVDYARVSSSAGVRFAGLSLAGEETIRTPLQLWELLDSIRMGGQEVEVTWSAFTRRGLLAEAQAKPRHEDLIEVVLSFDWTGRGLSRGTVSTPFDWRGPTANLRQIMQGIADLLAAPGRIAADWLEQANAAVAQLQTGVDAFSAVVDEYLALGDAGRDLLGNLASLGSVLSTSSVAFAELLETEIGTLVGSEDLSVVSGGGAIVAKGQDFARQIKEQAEKIRREALALLGGDDVVAVEIAVQGATLQQYAAAYYRDPSAWTKIARYNGKSSPTLEAGEIIAIPVFSWPGA